MYVFLNTNEETIKSQLWEMAKMKMDLNSMVLHYNSNNGSTFVHCIHNFIKMTNGKPNLSVIVEPILTLCQIQ